MCFIYFVFMFVADCYQSWAQGKCENEQHPALHGNNNHCYCTSSTVLPKEVP